MLPTRVEPTRIRLKKQIVKTLKENREGLHMYLLCKKMGICAEDSMRKAMDELILDGKVAMKRVNDKPFYILKNSRL